MLPSGSMDRRYMILAGSNGPYPVAFVIPQTLDKFGGNSSTVPSVPRTESIRSWLSFSRSLYSAAATGAFRISLRGDDSCQLKNHPKLARSITSRDKTSAPLKRDFGCLGQ